MIAIRIDRKTNLATVIEAYDHPDDQDLDCIVDMLIKHAAEIGVLKEDKDVS